MNKSDIINICRVSVAGMKVLIVFTLWHLSEIIYNSKLIYVFTLKWENHHKWIAATDSVVHMHMLSVLFQRPIH